MRTAPNIIITGTPGVGKTIHSEQVAQDTGLQHMSINDIAKQRDCYDGYDEERQSWIIDEDKVCFSLASLPLLRLFLFSLDSVLISIFFCPIVTRRH
jgi:broad-specificity NMP kinase